MFAYLFEKLIDILFPKNCYGCFKAGNYLCSSCIKRKVKINYLTKCHVCNVEIRLGFLHSECAGKTFLDGLVCMANYDGLLKQMIHDVKYNNYEAVMWDLAKVLKSYMGLYKFDDVLITSVPLHRSKKWKRGFNQAEILAKAYNPNNYFELLNRNKKTKTQVKLDKNTREINLKGAFDVSCDQATVGNFMKSKGIDNLGEVIIFDDIYTTGSTLNECAKVLKNFGFEKVYGVVLARKGI